jgi:hypothetical protein
MDQHRQVKLLGININLNYVLFKIKNIPIT